MVPYEFQFDNTKLVADWIVHRGKYLHFLRDIDREDAESWVKILHAFEISWYLLVNGKRIVDGQASQNGLVELALCYYLFDRKSIEEDV